MKSDIRKQFADRVIQLRKDKGFFYFIDSLKEIPLHLRKLMDVTIAAKFTDAQGVQALNELSSTFRSFNTFDGYNHQNISSILSPVNLGIVPPLWEDNLPQVAIEFVTHGVPIITSNKGGAQEISKNNNFIFDPSIPRSLSEKIIGIQNGEIDASKFWGAPLNIFSNEMHMLNIINIYLEILNENASEITKLL